MSTVNMIKMIKEIHPEVVIFIKSGVFYNVYDKDAYIISYLCKYKLKTIGLNYAVCGFPKHKIHMVTNLLRNKKVNYMILDKIDQYDVLEEETFKNLNQYKAFYDKGYQYVTLKKRIDDVYNYLLSNMLEIKDVLVDIENIIDKRREISNSKYVQRIHS